MPVFEQYLSVVGRGVRAFLNLEAGVMRAGAAPSGPLRGELERQLGNIRRELEEAHRELASKDQELKKWRVRLSKSDIDRDASGIKPENIVWIFSTSRSGSTWLSHMMRDIGESAWWNEPAVGFLFGDHYYSVDERMWEYPQYIMGSHRETWLTSIKDFVMNGARANFPSLGGDEYLIIKEPDGAIGAPLLMEALPESRMIFLIRDPRDVVASWIDACREGSWSYERDKKLHVEGLRKSPGKDPVAFTEEWANNYLTVIGKAKEAYDAHRGYKVLVRYEELRADVLGEMRRIHSTLGIPADEEMLKRGVQKHSWENIPEEEKGEGKFYRKATPGSWKGDLTPEQARMVEEITASLLEEFYPSYEARSGEEALGTGI